ncbi:hypothetical protein M758_6G059800 [Ceratodon purpureus]|nr:hypothetical protein M758_6G059800 [Ceratodon purpureus]
MHRCFLSLVWLMLTVSLCCYRNYGRGCQCARVVLGLIVNGVGIYEVSTL